MGGSGSSSGRAGGGAGGAASLSTATRKSRLDDKTANEIANLKTGSEIEVTYFTGSKTVTDTFRKERKQYSIGSTIAWVNKTKNGWRNDFYSNSNTIKSSLFNSKVKITKRK